MTLFAVEKVDAEASIRAPKIASFEHGICFGLAKNIIQ